MSNMRSWYEHQIDAHELYMDASVKPIALNCNENIFPNYRNMKCDQALTEKQD